MNKQTSEHAIVLFDGVCHLCSGAVRFIVPRDPHGRMRFASLQSDWGQRLLRQYKLPSAVFDSIVLIDGERVYVKSSAVLRIAGKLRGFWPACSLLAAVPRPLRDAVYDWIARRRYRWFGRADRCMMPVPEWKERFLD